MKKSAILFALALLLSPISKAQTPETEKGLMNWDRGTSIETYFQNNFVLGLGGIVGKNFGDKMKANYSMGIYGDLVFVDRPIYAPRLKFTWNYLGIFGLNLNFANYYRQNKNDLRFTPEINFSVYGIANLYVGYSIPLGSHNFSELNEFKIGLNINITSTEK